MKLSTILLATLALSASLQAQAVQQPPGQAAAILERIQVARYSIQELETSAKTDGSLELIVQLKDGEAALVLEPYSLRSPSFRLLVENERGRVREVEAREPNTYRGVAYRRSGAADSDVAATLEHGNLWAFVRGQDGSIEVIQPLSDAVPGADPKLHLVYDANDSLPDATLCGVVAESGGAPKNTDPGGAGLAAGTTLSVCEIAFDADWEFYMANSGDLWSTYSDIERVLNGVSLIYEQDVAVMYRITHIRVRTGEPDPYSATEPRALLNQFRREWNRNQSILQRDVAHLMTGKDIDGNVVGYGLIGVICDKSAAYAFSQSRFSTNLQRRVALTSHELGHNWDSQHCDGDGDCSIMCASLGGCTGNLSGLGARTRQSIVRHRDRVGCLSDGPTTLDLPFSEEFPTRKISKQRWSSKRGAKVSKRAMNEPSGKRSVNLDAKRNGTADELISHQINLAGANNVKTRFQTQHRGVEAGEQLIVEYWSAAGSWVRLFTVTSDGIDQTTFSPVQLSLPPAALHGKFKLRFRPQVDEKNDEWFLDDVYVGP